MGCRLALLVLWRDLKCEGLELYVWSLKVKAVGDIWTCFNKVFPWYINVLLNWMTYNPSLLFLALCTNLYLISHVIHELASYITGALCVYLIRFITYPLMEWFSINFSLMCMGLQPKFENSYQTISRTKKADCQSSSYFRLISITLSIREFWFLAFCGNSLILEAVRITYSQY